MNNLKEKLVSVLAIVLLTVSGSSASECVLESIALDSTIVGSWSTDCNATHREGSYAKYYTFTVANDETVRIDLMSSVDTYLYLLQDANTSGSVINSDDDGGEGFNSQISSALSAGTYTIEATTFNAGEIGDFNLSLKKVVVNTYRVKGKIALPSEVLDRMQNCQNDGCPHVEVYADYYNERYNQQLFSSVDYNDTTGNYEYHLDLMAESNSSATIDMDIEYGWMEESGEEVYRYFDYSFGADNAVGGTGDNADYPIDNGCSYPQALNIGNVELLPQVDINLSSYVPTIYSSLSMEINNVPSTFDVSLYAYDPECPYAWNTYSSYFDDGNGKRTLTINGLIDGHEYGLLMWVNGFNGYEEGYRLNDDDGDFTNGGVFVEEYVEESYECNNGYEEACYRPVFDKTFFATPEDINISAPKNLSFGNPAQVPLMYLLLM